MHMMRAHPFVARWPVTYWNDELFGQGTVLEISHAGCRMAGTMIVTEGVPLKLWIAPPDKQDQLCVEEARVLRVKDYEFEVAFRRLAAIDQRELLAFLENAERRKGQSRTSIDER